ncbi:5-methyltetrahydropteroyltriglutamate-homocysteine methyltransferase [Zopfia rhizophila CBS 207.26]|uniref:5-methyltetrahydropteroyltriglutamate-homocysteine methyltransferase n=1 Tax=Zopfia rhizophila CBS 207.26 TaxID=1314779 RepID=A0A6A6DPI6_9PEZI|nr:5-methyltetrahydropteroyltriglutamate-homocysteine methyltransferase [Zopfia rhizophila CBS 207.26]
MSSSTAHRDPPFRVEQVGSFLRPEYLLETRHRWEEKKASGEELRKAEDKAIKEIVKLQQDCGFHGINDGEYRRHMFWGTFWENLGGMVTSPVTDLQAFRHYVPDVKALLQNVHSTGETISCRGKLTHTAAASKDNLQQLHYLQEILPKEEHCNIKLTFPAPSWFHLRFRNGHAYPKDVYKSDDEYFADVIQVYEKELQVLYDHGLRSVQFDDPNICYFCNTEMIEEFNKDKSNNCTADELFDKYIEVYNKIMTKVPKGMHIGVHLCRGNFAKSQHFTEGAYDRIAARLLRNLDVHTLYLEFDTERAGGFEPLKHLVAGKTVILGVISSKFPELEDLNETVARIREAAKWVAKGRGVSEEEALDQLGVSPQCGFASHSSGNAITWDDMVAKMKLVRSVADKVWPGQP